MKIPDSSTPSSLRKFAGPLVAILALWGVMGLLLLAELFPYRPSAPLGWVALFILGVPAYLLLEGLGELGVDWMGRKLRGKRSGP